MGAQEFTKEEIFNMSDEEFEKHYGELKNNMGMEQLLNTAPEPNETNKPNDSQQDDKSNQGNEPSGETNLDKNFKLWNNSNNVTPPEPTPPQNTEGGEQNTGDDNTTPEPNVEDKGVKQQEPQQVYEIKSYGQKYNFTIDELKELAPKALHYIKKLQKIAPYRRTISAMEQNGVTEDDINQFIEMKKGNKIAINNFLSKNKIDAYELSLLDSQESIKYKPLTYGEENTPLSNIIEDLGFHPRSAELARYVGGLDQVSRDKIKQHPEVLETLMSNIENGYFDIILPEANKRAFLDGNRKPMIEYYAECANEYYKYLEEKENQHIEKQKQQKQQEENVARDNARNNARISGNLGKQMNTQPREIRSGYDITEEEFAQFEKDFGIKFS